MLVSTTPPVGVAIELARESQIKKWGLRVLNLILKGLHNTFPGSRMPASIEESLQLVVCLSVA
jgi:hypothetical protein